MRVTDKNLGLLWKRRAAQILAVFFVLYALADASVLQVYCGNELLGIPPDHHSIEKTNNSVQSGQETCAESDKADCRQTPDDHDYDHHHECFCWQQVIVGLFFFKPMLSAESQKTPPSVFYKNKYSNSDPSGFFRPPRIA